MAESRRALLCSVLVGCIGLCARIARADGDIRDCNAPRPIAGTVPYGLGLDAARKNAHAFSAAHFAELTLFPDLDREREEKDTVAVYGFGSSAIYGAVQIPSVDVASGCPTSLQYSTRPLDLMAMTQGFAVKFGDVGLFYATGLTASYVPPGLGGGALGNAGYRGVSTPLMFQMYALPYSYAAPFGAKGFSKGPQSFQVDYVAGAQADVTNLGIVRAGYVGSTGLYTNVTARQIRAFLSSMLTEELGLGYLAAGLNRQQLGGMLLSAYGRKLPLTPAPRISARTAALADPQSQLSLSSLHTQVLSIGGMFDLMAAYIIKPTPTLHELRVGIHTPGYQRPTDLPVGDESSDDFAGCGVWSGIVRLPDMWYYGIEGKVRFALDAGCRVRDEHLSEFRIGIRRNDPDTLGLFPYAVDAWNGYFDAAVNF